MKQIKVYLYHEMDGSYSCYMEDDAQVPYGLIGEGKTVQEAMDSWNDCYQAMKSAFADGKHSEFVEAELSFVYDLE